MNNVTHFKYTGTALPADSDTVTLLDTFAAGMPPHAFQHQNLRRVVIDLAHSHIGTVKFYKSDPDGVRGTDWTLVASQAIAVPSTGTDQIQFIVQPYPDFKIDWTNGGTTQTQFEPNITADSEGILI